MDDKKCDEMSASGESVSDYLQHLITDNQSLSQMILYENDMSKYYFNDGTHVQLSSCGANYIYITSTSHQPHTSQLCRYATSETRDKVNVALKFRNLFASRAYVMVSDADDEKLVVKTHNNKTWTNSSQTNKSVNFLSPERNVNMIKDRSSHITQVDFLSEISYQQGGNKQQLVWVRNIFPASKPPPHWRHLAEDDGREYEIPLPYNKTCDKQFRHEWSNAEDENDGEPIKLFYTDQTFYWIIRSSTVPMMQIWLDDGSVMMSRPDNKFYYNHITYNTHEEQQQRTYSATSLPRDERLKNIVLRANRLMIGCQTTRQTSSTCCLDDYDDDDDDLSTNRPYIPSHIAHLPDLGRFSYVDGNVQIRFIDHVTLYCDVTNEQFDMLCGDEERALRTIRARIFFPDGAYIGCDDLFDVSDRLAPYVRPCRDWLRWLLGSEAQKRESPFYDETVFSNRVSDLIDDELSKIFKFTTIMCRDDQDVIPCANDDAGEDFDVEEMLRRNSEALQQIENILNK